METIGEEVAGEVSQATSVAEEQPSALMTRFFPAFQANSTLIPSESVPTCDKCAKAMQHPCSEVWRTVELTKSCSWLACSRHVSTRSLDSGLLSFTASLLIHPKAMGTSTRFL